MNHRQATHLFYAGFGVLGREPPGGTLGVCRQATLGVYTSSGFLDEGPGRANPAARRRERNGLIFMFLGFWTISNRGKICNNH